MNIIFFVVIMECNIGNNIKILRFVFEDERIVIYINMIFCLFFLLLILLKWYKRFELKF